MTGTFEERVSALESDIIVIKKIFLKYFKINISETKEVKQLEAKPKCS